VSGRLDFGIILGDAPTAVDARTHLDGILRQVDAAERAGFTHVTIGQHLLYPGYRWLQPIPLLARLAATTGPQLRLVTSVVIAPLYHPALLAEELATLDVVSDGRLTVGIGAGYRPEELAHVGVPHGERFARLEEALELIDLVWAGEPFDFDGRFWRLEGATPHVVPLQRPRPPLWLGALRPAGIRRAARLGDAWMVTPELPWDEVERGRAVFAAERDAHGLAPARLPLRREIVLGDSLDGALAAYEARTAGRYAAYAERGLAGADHRAGFRDWALDRAVLGTPEECVARLAAIDADAFGPVVVRPSWPGMETADVVAAIEALGRDVIAPLHESREALR